MLKELEEALLKTLTDFLEPRRVFSRLQRLDVESILPTTKSLLRFFGLPVIVLGDKYPYKGQCYSVGITYVDNEEWYDFRTGWFEVWGTVETEKTRIHVPVMVNGLPTASISILFEALRRGGRFSLSVVGTTEFDRVLVPKNSIIHLDGVLSGSLPLIIADPYSSLSVRSYEDALERSRLMFYSMSIYKAYNTCRDEKDRLLLERYSLMSEVSRLRDLVKDLYVRLEESRQAVYELEHEVRMYRTSIEVYSRRYSDIEEYAKALTERLGRLEETLHNVIDKFSSTIKSFEAVAGVGKEEKVEEGKKEVKEY
jgi:hypothetical protein